MIASPFRLETAMPIRFVFLFVLHLPARTTAFALLAVCATLVWALPALATRADELYGAPPENLAEYLDRLAQFYPATISRHDAEFLYLKDGTKFPISDHRTDKTFQELLEKPDIADMFYAPYPKGTLPKQPDKNMDPGRVRFEPLFVVMYGDCRKNEVTKSLRTIKWLPKHGGGSVTITRINGVDKALEAVSLDLDELPDDLIKYLKPTAGSYNCRVVAGTNYMSMHAYAAAIDINGKYANYWRWALNDRGEPKWTNQIPITIVRIFEKHGFIWGGYWYHYDTMHFEYRPELLPSEGRAG
jgi:D-alanyl-D-alanine carboxypeptidase